jgi:hypothetical protein
MQVDITEIGNWQNMPASAQQQIVASVVDLINRLLVASYKGSVDTPYILSDPVLSAQLQMALGST